MDYLVTVMFSDDHPDLQRRPLRPMLADQQPKPPPNMEWRISKCQVLSAETEVDLKDQMALMMYRLTNFVDLGVDYIEYRELGERKQFL